MFLLCAHSFDRFTYRPYDLGIPDVRSRDALSVGCAASLANLSPPQSDRPNEPTKRKTQRDPIRLADFDKVRITSVD
jgi:hypothetical protein